MSGKSRTKDDSVEPWIVLVSFSDSMGEENDDASFYMGTREECELRYQELIEMGDSEYIYLAKVTKKAAPLYEFHDFKEP